MFTFFANYINSILLLKNSNIALFSLEADALSCPEVFPLPPTELIIDKNSANSI
jgi:hypothetical protein